MSESDLKRTVLAWLKRQPDVFAFKVHGSAFQRVGLPDIVGSVGACALWIELKRPDGRGVLSPIQRVTHARIRAAGSEVLVAESLEQVKAHVARLRSNPRDVAPCTASSSDFTNDAGKVPP